MSYYTRSPDEYTQTQSLRLEIYFVADPLLIYTRLDISLFLHLLLCSILWWFGLVSTTETCVCARAHVSTTGIFGVLHILLVVSLLQYNHAKHLY